MRPVNRSVTAKQASRMFVLLGRFSRFFTALMTNTFNRTVKGQAMPLIIMVPTVKKNWSWTLPAAVSFSMTSMVAFCKILLVVFVELKLEKVAMLFEMKSLRKQLSLWSIFYLKPKPMILIEVSSSDCFYLTTSSHWSGLGSVQFPPLQFFLVFPLDWNIFPLSKVQKAILQKQGYNI